MLSGKPPFEVWWHERVGLDDLSSRTGRNKWALLSGRLDGDTVKHDRRCQTTHSKCACEMWLFYYCMCVSVIGKYQSNADKKDNGAKLTENIRFCINAKN